MKRAPGIDFGCKYFLVPLVVPGYVLSPSPVRFLRSHAFKPEAFG